MMSNSQLTLEKEFRHLHHKGDPESSVDASKNITKSGQLSKQEKEVCEALKRYDCPSGHTPKELAYLMNEDNPIRNYFKIERRLSGLLKKRKAGRLKLNGEISFAENPKKDELIIRKGCCVWRPI